MHYAKEQLSTVLTFVIIFKTAKGNGHFSCQMSLGLIALTVTALMKEITAVEVWDDSIDKIVT